MLFFSAAAAGHETLLPSSTEPRGIRCLRVFIGTLVTFMVVSTLSLVVYEGTRCRVRPFEPCGFGCCVAGSTCRALANQTQPTCLPDCQADIGSVCSIDHCCPVGAICSPRQPGKGVCVPVLPRVVG